MAVVRQPLSLHVGVRFPPSGVRQRAANGGNIAAAGVSETDAGRPAGPYGEPAARSRRIWGPSLLRVGGFGVLKIGQRDRPSYNGPPLHSPVTSGWFRGS